MNLEENKDNKKNKDQLTNVQISEVKKETKEKNNHQENIKKNFEERTNKNIKGKEKTKEETFKNKKSNNIKAEIKPKEDIKNSIEKKQNKEEDIQEKSLKNIEKNNENTEKKSKEDIKNNIKEKEKVKEKSLENNKKSVVEERHSNDNLNIEQEDFEATKKQNNYSKTFKLTVILIIIIASWLLLSTIFAILNVTNNKIIEGVFIKEIEVSNLTKEEAINKINNTIEEKIKQNIVVNYEEYESSTTPEQLEVKFDVKGAVDTAYSIGRSSNIIKNNYAILNAKFKNKNINLNLNMNINEELLDKTIKNISLEVPGVVQESSYYIEGSDIIITSGIAGMQVDENLLKSLIISNINEFNYINTKISIPTNYKEPDKIDINKIYKEVYKESQDAYYVKEPFQIYPHVDGVDFGISIEEAEKLLNEQKQEYIIPLKIISPQKTTNQIGTEVFPDLISSFSTKYDASNRNRTTNLKLASEKINGTVVLPGEIFSYNKVVGERTISAGYKQAAVFQNGKVVDGLGGGICQISSTLYDAAVYANLEIIERSNHMFVTSYVGAGKDATVVYGARDFSFKNTRTYPIKIVFNVNNGVAKVELFGIKENVEYEIEMEVIKKQVIPCKVQYEISDSLAPGTSVVKQNGYNGCKTETYKVQKLNGVVVSRTLLSQDVYSSMPKIITKGRDIPTVDVQVQ